MRYLENGEKVRIAKKSGALLRKPDNLAYVDYVKKVLKTGVGPKDTAPQALLKSTLETSPLNRLD
jgi:hypothetical protein